MGCGGSTDKTPPNWPEGVQVESKAYMTWDRQVYVPTVWWSQPKTADELVTVCNWAADNGWRVRVVGCRLSWSPAILARDAKADDKVVLVNMKQTMCTVDKVANNSVKVQAGAKLEDVVKDLADASKHGAAYQLDNYPGCGFLTMGACIAQGCHGSSFAVPGAAGGNHGTMSNSVVEMTVVAYDAASKKYALRTVKRTDGDVASALLAHQGRSLTVDVTVQVFPQQHYEVITRFDVPNTAMYAAPNEDGSLPENCFASFADANGHVSVILTQYAEAPLTRYWKRVESQPEGSRPVTTPYNYPYLDELPFGEDTVDVQEAALNVPPEDALGKPLTSWLNNHGLKIVADGADVTARVFGNLREFFSVGSQLTPAMSRIAAHTIESGAEKTDSNHLYGPQGALFLYVRQTTMKIADYGFCIQTRRDNLQRAAHEVFTTFSTLLGRYAHEQKYPINIGMELRVGGVDAAAAVSADAAPTWLTCASADDDEAKANGWDTQLWIEVITLPNTQHNFEYCNELENLWRSNPHLSGANGRVRGEWTKLFCADKAAPWADAALLRQNKATYPNWDKAVAQLDALDEKKIFSNTWLDRILATK